MGPTHPDHKLGGSDVVDHHMLGSCANAKHTTAKHAKHTDTGLY
jgi:hypothetical protein